MAEFARITARQWQTYQTHLKRENPILIGLRYLKAFEQESVLRFFTERRLRPLTMISDEETQVARFAELLAAARDGASDS